VNFVRHPKTNFNFGAPKDWDHSKMHCGSLPCRVGRDPHTNGPVIRSYWQPAESELWHINNGGAIELTIHDVGMAPVSMAVVPADHLTINQENPQ